MIGNNPSPAGHAPSAIPLEILDDLCSRFLINVPDTERTDLVRLCFQLEQAHWFYLDFYVDNKELLDKGVRCKSIGYREFARVLFGHCPFLQPIKDQADAAIEQWRMYKAAVPTYGAVLLDERLEQVLLVQGYYAKCSWGFPKGKVNQEELPHDCAIREVLEETGFDISQLISRDDYLELQMHESLTRLYLVPNVPRDFDFQPQTRNEIKRIQWFRLSDLPTHKQDRSKESIGIYPNHFYTLLQFVDSIKQWCQHRILTDKQNRPHRFGPQNNSRRNFSPKNVGGGGKSKQHYGNTSSQQNQRNHGTKNSTGHNATRVKDNSGGSDKDQGKPELGEIHSAKAWVCFSLNWDKILLPIGKGALRI